MCNLGSINLGAHPRDGDADWVFRDESMHMAFAFDVVDTVRAEEPDLFDDTMVQQVIDMLAEAVECEVQFAADLLEQGVSGMSPADMRVSAARRRPPPGPAGHRPAVRQPEPVRVHGAAGRPGAVELLRAPVSAYQVGVTGSVSFDDDF